MRNTLIRDQKGFSLVEMAIAMIVIGVLLVPALHGYSLFLQDQRRDETVTAVTTATQAIGNFRSIYGRYPCPARPDAVLGDADYGMESRAGDQCVDAGDIVIVASNKALPNQDVAIGALPFRQLNLPHELIYDGENNQLTYAVTEMMTDDTTFANDMGGITVLDVDDNQLTTNPDSAHFIVISHSENNVGAISREGANVGDCATQAPVLERENCDRADAVFRAGAVGDAFDDITSFSVTDGIEQWQLSAANAQDIQLRRSTSFAIGPNTTDDTSSFATAEVALSVVDDATILVEDSTVVSDTGAVKSDSLCTTGGTNCFRPDLIAGQTADESLTCDGNPAGPYLIGIRNGTPVCTDEVDFSCPTGEYVTGFDSSGNLICDTEPPIACPDQVLTTTCGPARNVTSFFNGGTYYGYAFSGECHRIRELDDDDIDDIVDDYDPTDPNFYDPGGGFDQAMQEIRDEIDIYNNEIRTTEDCAATGTNALIRDTFRCENGAWNTTPVRVTEKLENTEDFSGFGPLYTGGYHPAEAPGVSYNSSSPMAVDPNNTNNQRDCWCREDYRLVTTGCGGGLAGQRFRIDRHICPQTQHSWQRVYPDSGSYNTGFCGCAESTSDEQMTCAAYYGYSGNGISGYVDFTRTVSCGTGSPVTTDSGHDDSACFCPDRNDTYRTEACPFGTTNNFTYNGTNYSGVENIYRTEWSCPTGPAPAPVSGIGDAGSYGAETLVHNEPCVCNSSLTQAYHEDCPAGYQGAGIDWELPYNCTTSSFDPPSDANKVSEDCSKCIWQAGTPRSPGETFSYGAEYEVGDVCPACSGTGSCYEVVGTNEFEIWDGCYCAGQ